MNHLKVIFSTALVTVFLALGLLWLTVELGWLSLSPDPLSATADPLAMESKPLSKKNANFICEVTVSMPQKNLTVEPKVYTDFLVAGLDPEGKSGWYHGEFSISESRKGTLRMDGTKAFVSRPAMFERFGQMITQEEFTLDLSDGMFVQTLTFRDGGRRHIIKGVCARYAKAPFH
jgi:hypothetical protein